MALHSQVPTRALKTLRECAASPPPWTVEQTPGGYKVKDANGQALAYVYARETQADADIANVLTVDEAWRVANNIAKSRRCLEIKA